MTRSRPQYNALEYLDGERPVGKLVDHVGLVRWACAMVTAEQLRIFAERGYVVLPGVVPSDALEMARAEIARTVSADPPSSDHVGPCFYWPAIDDVHPFTGLLTSGRVLAAAEALMRLHRIDRPDMAQIALNIPPFPYLPGGPHIEGLTPAEPDGRPGTFMMLAGIILTDQPGDDMRNLWVWPGTHLTAAAYFRTHGADALLTAIPYPPVELPEPQQVYAQAGDLAGGALPACPQQRRQHRTADPRVHLLPPTRPRPPQPVARSRSRSAAGVSDRAGKRSLLNVSSTSSGSSSKSRVQQESGCETPVARTRVSDTWGGGRGPWL